MQTEVIDVIDAIDKRETANIPRNRCSMPSKLSQEKYKELIHSCVENCPAPYCFFKVFVESQHPSERTLIQIKCIEIFKYYCGQVLGVDIGFPEACQRWVDEGYAKAFSMVFDETKSIKEIYELTEKQKIILNTKPSVEVIQIETTTNVSSQVSILTVS